MASTKMSLIRQNKGMAANLFQLSYDTLHKLPCGMYLQAPTLYTVKGILILDNDGERVWANYYDPNIFPTRKEQRTFEKSLFSKTAKANAEVCVVIVQTSLYINSCKQ